MVLALTSASKGEVERAVTLWSARVAAAQAIGWLEFGPELSVYVKDTLEPLQRSEGFAATWEVGRAMTRDAALELGLTPPA